MKLFDLKYFFKTDSQYTLRCATSSKPTSNSDLVLLLDLDRSSFQIDLCWTKDHEEIGGNRVDQLSKNFFSKVVLGFGPEYKNTGGVVSSQMDKVIPKFVGL